MPRQNRVTPFGDMITTPERGTFMGNRGVLHDDEGYLRRAWKVKRWLICVLEFRGKWRQVMAPRRYTHLFFLDEATALAAGHRPCAECRHARFIDFCNAWKKGHPRRADGKRPRADAMDEQLHAERVGPQRSKGSFTTNLDEVPDGVFVTSPTWGADAFLVLGDALLSWSPAGYAAPRRRPKHHEVIVLTPRSTVRAICAGYVPEIHPSAFAFNRSALRWN